MEPRKMYVIPTEENVINEFRGENNFLSNFYLRRIFYKGLLFPSVEHAYQANKGNSEFAKKIASLEKPVDAKKEAKLIALPENWEENKIKIMADLIFLKFGLQNKDLRDKLANTQYKNIVEGNFWHDNFWGHCYCDRCKTIEKKNMLGQILMLMRENILYVNKLK